MAVGQGTDVRAKWAGARVERQNEIDLPFNQLDFDTGWSWRPAIGMEPVFEAKKETVLTARGIFK